MAKVVNGNKNILTEDQEHMRLQIIDLELKARYWEAQWKVRFYTLESEKLQPEYNEFLKVEEVKREQSLKKFQEQIDSMNKQAGFVPKPSPVLEQDTIETPEELKA